MFELKVCSEQHILRYSRAQFSEGNSLTAPTEKRFDWTIVDQHKQMSKTIR